MNITYVICFFCLFFNVCSAERYIQATKYEDQEMFYLGGAPILASKKTNSVVMYQTGKTINSNRGNFYFLLSNNTELPMNFHLSNLRVTDQWGRYIRIVPKKELINDKESSKNWKLFASALCAGLQSVDASNAGNIQYQSQTNGTCSSNYNSYGSSGYNSGNIYGRHSSTTSGTVQVDALRIQAQRQVQADSQQRSSNIQQNFDDWSYNLSNFYFDTTTVFPGTEYSANFQIDINKSVEKDLQYLIFNYDLEGEKHTFCFYCGIEKKKWYRLGL